MKPRPRSSRRSSSCRNAEASGKGLPMYDSKRGQQPVSAQSDPKPRVRGRRQCCVVVVVTIIDRFESRQNIPGRRCAPPCGLVWFIIRVQPISCCQSRDPSGSLGAWVNRRLTGRFIVLFVPSIKHDSVNNKSLYQGCRFATMSGRARPIEKFAQAAAQCSTEVRSFFASFAMST